MSGDLRADVEYFLTDEGRRTVEEFMVDAANEGDDFDIDEVIARNHADAECDWFGADGPIPAREDLR